MDHPPIVASLNINSVSLFCAFLCSLDAVGSIVLDYEYQFNQYGCFAPEIRVLDLKFDLC